jgi:hypothetical protein
MSNNILLCTSGSAAAMPCRTPLLHVDHPGYVINVSSVAGQKVGARFAVYAATSMPSPAGSFLGNFRMPAFSPAGQVTTGRHAKPLPQYWRTGYLEETQCKECLNETL